jgi:hypothetical protein
VCAECVSRSAKDLRLYPHGYVVAIGILANPVVAAILMAINYSRLGDRDRVRQMAITAVVLGVVLAIWLALPTAPTWLALPIGVAISTWLARPYRETWHRLKAAGAQRANVFLPIVFVVFGVVALGAIVVAVSPS